MAINGLTIARSNSGGRICSLGYSSIVVIPYVEDRVGDIYRRCRYTYARKTRRRRPGNVKSRGVYCLPVMTALARPRINSRRRLSRRRFMGTLGPHRVRAKLSTVLAEYGKYKVSSRVCCERRSNRELRTKTLRDDISASTIDSGFRICLALVTTEYK